MIPSPYFSPLLAVVIDEIGQYKTRSGEIVKVTKIIPKRCNGKPLFNCLGYYPDGVKESWHVSGRIFPNTDSKNDIVEKVPSLK